MSWKAGAWAWSRDLPPNQKYVLLCYADAADHDGVTVASVRKISKLTGLSPSAVKDNRARLIEAGVLASIPRFRENGSQQNGYTILCPGGDRTPMEDPDRDSWPDDVVTAALVGVGNPATVQPAGRGGSSEGDPLDGQKDGRKGGSGDPRAELLKGVGKPDVVPLEMITDAVALLQRKTKVDGKIVNVEEMAKAAMGLAEFNRQSGYDYGLGANLTGVVMRVREYPSWDGDKHVRLVQSAFRTRWWERNGSGRRPSPNVIWGNTGCFQNVAQDAAEEARNGGENGAGRFKPRNEEL